jgi:hypothetical protein
MPMGVLGIIITNYSILQIMIQVFHQGCQRIIEEVAMWQIPMKTQVIEHWRLEQGTLSETTVGHKNMKIFPTGWFTATFKDIFLTGYTHMDFENPSNTTKITIFPTPNSDNGPDSQQKFFLRVLSQFHRCEGTL